MEASRDHLEQEIYRHFALNYRRTVALNGAGELSDDTSELEAGGNPRAIG